VTPITLEIVRDTWFACYTAERLAVLYATPKTVLEVLTLQDGEWATVPAKDRIWTVCHSFVMSRELAIEFAKFCAEQAKSYAAADAYTAATYAADAADAADAATYAAAAAAAYTAAADAATYAADADARQKQINWLVEWYQNERNAVKLLLPSEYLRATMLATKKLPRGNEGRRSLYRVSKDTGISQSLLARFLTKERSLSLENFDTLCAYYGLALLTLL
jgi:hypothetical protein